MPTEQRKDVSGMPLVNYCKKCRAETPIGESCPYCGGKLSQTGEMISFGLVRRVVKEWFAWNNLLRILLPVWVLIVVIVLASEWTAAGAAGVEALMEQGLMSTLFSLLAAALALIWLLLSLQGVESVHVVLDKQGVHVRTYIHRHNTLGLYARFASPQTVERLTETDDRPELDGLMLVRRVTLPWNDIRRVKIWREGSTILFFRPSFWQVAAVRVSFTELPEAEEYIRRKMKRVKKAKVLPLEKPEKKKKR